MTPALSEVHALALLSISRAAWRIRWPASTSYPEQRVRPPSLLRFDVSYDRTRLAQRHVATAVAIIKSHLSRTANMVMVDRGIPPGFDLLSEDLDDYRSRNAGPKSGRLPKLNLTCW